jgi:hypothetical protein
LILLQICARFDFVRWALPDFLIIDTPMKNISEDVNRGIFEAFYNYLYDLAKGPLSNTQFIIIDKEYLAPRIQGLNIMNSS